MAKFNKRNKTPSDDQSAPKQSGLECFTFGEPERVNLAELLGYAEVFHNGTYYLPPVSYADLMTAYNASVHHASALQVRRNILLSLFVDSPLLSPFAMDGFLLDYAVLANAFLLARRNRMGDIIRLEHVPAKYMRLGLAGDFYYLRTGQSQSNETIRYIAEDVYHLKNYDINQEIYGIPDYLSAMHSIGLNNSATLFRRRYFDNGAHAGFILYLTDPAANQTDVEGLRERLKETRGMGNFKNVMFYAPGGKSDGVKILPISEIAAKDDFLAIKNTSRDDILAMHRVPLALMSIPALNAGGHGNAREAAAVFFENELRPLMKKIASINAYFDAKAVAFGEYSLMIEG